MTPYATTAEGNTYFEDFLWASAWNDAADADRLKALKTATRAIDRLSFLGKKHADAQENQFPRGDDTAVPQDIKDACCELALAFLDGVDPRMEIDDASATSYSIGGVTKNKDAGFLQEHVRAGIPSVTAWHYLLPYLRDPYTVRLERDT